MIKARLSTFKHCMCDTFMQSSHTHTLHKISMRLCADGLSHSTEDITFESIELYLQQFCTLMQFSAQEQVYVLVTTEDIVVMTKAGVSTLNHCVCMKNTPSYTELMLTCIASFSSLIAKCNCVPAADTQHSDCDFVSLSYLELHVHAFVWRLSFSSKRQRIVMCQLIKQSKSALIAECLSVRLLILQSVFMVGRVTPPR